MPSVNRQWVLAKRPHGMIQESDFEWREAPMPALLDGHALVRNLWLSFDPTQRGWVEDRPSYMPPVQIGEPMRAGAVGQVIESKAPNVKPGDLVQGLFGWQDYVVAPGAMLAKVPAGVAPTHLLGVLGVTGLTAYFGVLDLGKPKAGETFVVSGAAGATGSVAGQIAKIQGARVVGIAGGPDKCRWLVEKAHFDGAVDYKNEDISKRLGELCPKGINVLFENVGGACFEASLDHLAQHARIALCGSISQYNEKEPQGPRNFMNLVVQRAHLDGFIVIDYVARFAEASKQLATWVAEGKIVHQEDVQHGLENAPKTLLRLFQGRNTGKQILQIAEPPLPRA
jgi:NADPH-dependent curcumin reductase